MSGGQRGLNLTVASPNHVWIEKSPLIERGLLSIQINLFSPTDDGLFILIFIAIAQRREQADRHEGANKNERD